MNNASTVKERQVQGLCSYEQGIYLGCQGGWSGKAILPQSLNDNWQYSVQGKDALGGVQAEGSACAKGLWQETVGLLT